jgi:hypothetical protein
METQDDFFSPKHNLMMNFAMWANVLAWVALFFYALRAWVTAIQYRMSMLQAQDVFTSITDTLKFWSLLGDQPYYLISMVVAMLSLIMRGVIYYLILKSVALGLNMIVETDVNYRVKQMQEGDQ